MTAETAPTPDSSAWSRAERRPKPGLRQLVRRHQTMLPAAGLLGLMVLAAIFAGLLTPFDPRDGALDARLVAPFVRADHPFGTDPIGRDTLSRLLYGARVSLSVGFASVLLAGVAGSLLGLVAGWRGGWVDTLIMRIADVQLGFPSFLLAITLMATFGAGLGSVVLALSIGGWVRYARVMRSTVLPLCEVEYVQAAQALGCGATRIVLRHVLPNALTPVLVIATLSLGGNIITESSLSFLGLGVDPQTPSWGSMLADGRPYLNTAWWVSALPGLAISLTVLAVNLLGDWLRDELDPRLRGSRS